MKGVGDRCSLAEGEPGWKGPRADWRGWEGAGCSNRVAEVLRDLRSLDRYQTPCFAKELVV